MHLSSRYSVACWYLFLYLIFKCELNLLWFLVTFRSVPSQLLPATFPLFSGYTNWFGDVGVAVEAKTVVTSDFCFVYLIAGMLSIILV